MKTAWLRELQSFAFVAAVVLSPPPYVRSCDISSQLDTAMEVKPSTYVPELFCAPQRGSRHRARNDKVGLYRDMPYRRG